MLFAAFGAVALVLAAGGVYGLASFSVSQRRKEIGIRLAVGATGGAVRRMVLSEGARLALIGCGIGLGLAWVLARLVASALFGVTTLEPMGFAAVAALLCAAVVAATWSPAARAGGWSRGRC